MSTLETITLDPNEFAPYRAELNLDELGIRIDGDGADWGESQVAVQLQNTPTGAVVTHRQLEPVDMSIPLQLKDEGAVSLAEAAYKLQQKVGIFQSEDSRPNWIRRDFDDGGEFVGSVGYVIYAASLSGIQGWMMAHRGRAPDVMLHLTRGPICYSTEEVESEVFVEEANRGLKWELSKILGTAPGLIRVKATNNNGAGLHWRGLINALESRDHPQNETKNTTADLRYQAEKLTLAGGTAEAEREGLKVARNSTLSAGWITILSSGHMTHTGVRRLWARAFDPAATAGTVELRAHYRSLGSPTWTETDLTSVPTKVIGAFSLLDLGECRPERAILGDQRWEWRIQARSPSGSEVIDLDETYIVPVEQYAVLRTPAVSLSPDALSTKSPATIEDKAGGGSTAWVNPGNAASSNNVYATATLTKWGLSGAKSKYLFAKKFGFAIPGGATVLGIVFRIEKKATSTITDSEVFIVKAGAAGTVNHHSAVVWPAADAYSNYGASDDLWGQTWTPAQINEEGFGLVLSAVNGGAFGAEGVASVDHIQAIVYYTEATDENRVCFATRSVEVRSDGAYRQHSTDDVWGSVINEGYNPQAPPSWLEGRAVRGLILPSQGDLGSIADSGTNKIKAQVIYQPGYHFARETV